MKFFIFTENKQCGTRLEYGIWRNCHINFVVFPDGNNIDSEFFPDIQLTDCFGNPVFRNFHFKNCMCLIHLNIIAYVIGSIPDSSPLCNLFFRINNFVCTVSQKKFFLYIPFCTLYNRFCTEFFEQGSSFKGILEISTYRYHTYIKITNAKGF